MFRFFKKKRELSKTEELLNMAVEDIRDRWISYTQSKRFKNDVTLSENIDNFVQPLTEFFKSRYLNLYQYDSSIFWYTVSTAILNSKTHPKYDVDSAINEVNAKYAK